MFSTVDQTISKKKRLELVPAISEIFDTFIDCLYSYQEFEECQNDIIPIATDLILLVSDNNIKNIFKWNYINNVIDIYPKIKSAMHDCYTYINKAKLTEIKRPVRDLAMCGSDLQKSWSNFEIALNNKDSYFITKSLQKMATILTECKDALVQENTCEIALTGLSINIVSMIKLAKERSLDLSEYIRTFQDFIQNGKSAISKCYKISDTLSKNFDYAINY